MSTGFENIESFHLDGLIKEVSVESLSESTWNSPEQIQSELSENCLESSHEYSKNLIDEYIEKHERLYDSEVSKEIAAELGNMEGLRYENWSHLSENEKLDLLNNVEQTQAALERRDAMTVEFEDLPRTTFGYQDADNNRIVINRAHIQSDHPFYHREAIDTIIHEGRHAYQHYNVAIHTTHESDAEVASWRENFYDPKYGYYQSLGQKMYIPVGDGTYHEMSDNRLYEYQPVEIDARNFASDVMSKLDEQGLFGPDSKRH